MAKLQQSAFFKSVFIKILGRWLGVGAICLAALVPLWGARFPVTHDGLIHLFRTVEFSEAIRQGVLWPRYVPDIAYGYGYPLYNFNPPLVYFLGVGLNRLGLDFMPAFSAIMGGAIVVGALGVFKLTEEFFGPEAGYVAAAIYAFAPYTLLNVLARGDAPEALAVAWLPWLIWSLHRVFVQPRGLAVICLSGLYAALLFTHNISALNETGMLVILLGVELWAAIHRQGLRDGFTRAAWAVGALGLGWLIAACYWLPALAETRYVQISQLVSAGTRFYTGNFLTQLIAAPVPFDPHLVPTPFKMVLSLPAAGLALVGVAAVFRQPDRTLRWRGLALAVMFAGLVGLALPVSAPLWEHVSLLRLYQFPWRFLGPASVFAALLGGSAFGARARLGKWRALPVLALLITSVYGLSWTWCKYGPYIVHPARRDVYAYEQYTGLAGTTIANEFLPVWVTQMPPKERLAAQYVAGGVIDRLDRESLPETVAVTQIVNEFLSVQATFSAAQPFTVTFLWFYFPGWQANLDGQAVAVQPSKPHGLITVAVPAGEHTVRVFLGATPLQQLAGALSMAGIIGLAGVIVVLQFSGKPKATAQAIRPLAGPTVKPESQTGRGLMVLVVAGLSIGALRFYLDGRENPFRYSKYDGQRMTGVDQPVDVNFGDELNLIGVDRPTPANADQRLPVVLFWRPYGKTSRNYSTSVQLVDAAGRLFGQQDVYQPAGLPTSDFVPENYVRDEHPLYAYAGTPPGEYRLLVSVYPEAGAGPALTVYDANRLPSGNTVEVARITLTAPRTPPTDAELHPQHALSAQLGPLALVGVDLPAARVTPGDDLAFTLYWRVRTPAPGTLARLRLVSAGGQAETLGDFAPVVEGATPSIWQAGAGWRAPHQLLLPVTLGGGPAALRLSLINAAGEPLGDEVTLGSLEVSTPERQFTVPKISTRGDWRFGEAIRLLGYDLPVTKLAPGGALPVTLYWQAEAVMTRRYVVFVHVLDSAGQIAAQVDAIPLQGARPTTSWLPGEVLTDPYTVTLPAELKGGAYTVEMGLYDALTLERLPVTGPAVPGNTGQVILQTIQVEP